MQNTWKTVFHPARIGALLTALGAFIHTQTDVPIIGDNAGAIVVVVGAWLTGEIGANSRGTKDVVADELRRHNAAEDYGDVL